MRTWGERKLMNRKLDDGEGAVGRVDVGENVANLF